MKSSKQILSVVLLASGSLALGACGSKETAEEQPAEETAPEPVAEETTPEPVAEETPAEEPAETYLFMDVHHLGPGKITPEKVAAAHAKDLEIQDQYHVNYKNYWFNEKTGTIYCLAEAPSAEAANEVHQKSHGLVADQIVKVEPGVLPQEPKDGKKLKLFMDTHNLGEGKVTLDAVAGAHKKDLAIQEKYHVNYLKYWVNEEKGQVYCLVQAPSAKAAAKVHKEAHGLVADSIVEVKAPNVEAAAPADGEEAHAEKGHAH